ncbi:MBL fold metallo-hydrolase [Eubacteriales bacterium OttesenSCG-928-K08]|nr:MBL fold metallo-hydrolase [Eubacteriales bacterium OttesenSCG-928-K08]
MLLLDFINVGYGDAILLRETNSGYTLLVDCGDKDVGKGPPGSKRLTAAEFLRRENVERIDLVVLTHLHKDHAGGLLALSRQVAIGQLWSNYLPPSEAAPPTHQFEGEQAIKNLTRALEDFCAALEFLRARGTKLVEIKSAQPEIKLTSSLLLNVSCAPEPLIKLQADILDAFFTPPFETKGLFELDSFINDTSLRLTVEYEGRIIYLPGDTSASSKAQAEPKRCDILKLSHHGHKDAITQAQLNALLPEYVVVSVSSTRKDNCPNKALMEQIANQVPNVLFTGSAHIQGRAPAYHHSVRLCIDEGRIFE